MTLQNEALTSAPAAGTARQAALPTSHGLWEVIQPELRAIIAELPEGTTVGGVLGATDIGFITKRAGASLLDDDDTRRWLIQTLNAYVSVLRPQIKR